MPRKIILATIVVLLIGISATSMRIQEAKAQTTVNITLYGSAGEYGSAYIGWGYTATNITTPGPTIIIHQYDELNLTLYSQDAPGIHRFFVDYNNNSLIDDSEPASPFINSSTVGTPFEFNATISGTFTYRCYVHPSMMYGTIIIEPTVPEFPPILILPLFIAATTAATVAIRTKRSPKKMPDVL
jgi:FtsP/CotA-like multicopper oxidase with cupredoxin domain